MDRRRIVKRLIDRSLTADKAPRLVPPDQYCTRCRSRKVANCTNCPRPAPRSDDWFHRYGMRG